MIVADIIGCLGNQLFIYAATKSIALDLGYEYRYRVLKPTWIFGKNETIIEIGHQYIYDFEKAFHIDTSERLEDHIQLENSWTWNRLPGTNFNDEVYTIKDNTHCKGHYGSPKYFEHRRKEVLEWFKFRDEYLEKGYNQLKQIKETCKASQVIGIHMRYGNYRREGLSLDPSYYRNAVTKMRELLCDRDLCFILFSDEPKEAKALLNLSNVITVHGNFLDDLCLMTLCDGHIVSNSTFAWWGAWLSNAKIVIRPSIWYVHEGKLGNTDMYPSHWISVEAEREKLTPRIFINRIVDEYPYAIRTSMREPFVIFKKLVKKLLKIFLKALGII
jgi:hypothetical protein